VTKKIMAINPVATIVTAPWQDLPDTDILKIAEDDRIDKILDLTNYTYKYSKNDPISQISSLCFCPKKPHTKKEFRALLEKIATNKELGLLLRSKGFFSTPENKFIQFDYTPGAIKFTTSHTDAEDKIIIIGKNLNKPAIDKYFC
ncbi:MAG: GTP-binding protein, partial [Clostridiales bacterium]